MNYSLPQQLPHCSVPKRQFCELCRNKERGKPFRRGVLNRHGIDNVHADFNCPHNLPWVSEKSKGFGDTIEKAIKQATKPFVKGGIKPCGGCKKRKATLNRLIPYKQANRNVPNHSDMRGELE